MAVVSACSVNICVETLLENKIQEISRDGEEVYAPQLSMSEKLAELADKIDFHENSETKQEEDSDEIGRDVQTDDSTEEKALVTFQPSLWPWDSVRTKLRTMLTEVCVLSDILNIINDSAEKKYLVLDPVSQAVASPKTAVTLVAKKQSLAGASEILLQGAKRMSSTVEENKDRQKDFHSELMRVRQRWRMKRTASSITGDLTYKSAGSQFWHPGLFEVKKATVDINSQSAPNARALEVTVSSDLRGVCDMDVSVVNHSSMNNQINSQNEGHSRKRASSKNKSPFAVAPWQHKLTQAQNNLFTKELFAQLCHEACHNQGHITPFEVIDNQIKTEIFPDTHLCIDYRRISEDEINSSCNDTVASTKQGDVQSPHSHSLTYILKSLLRKQHQNNSLLSVPHPVTAAPVPGRNKRLCLAGAKGLTLAEVSLAHQSESLLKKFLKIAQHMVLRQRVVEVIDDISSEKCDPNLFCQWSSVCSETSCSGTIRITSPGKYSLLARTSFQLRVGVQEVKAICADGKIINISSRVEGIKAFIRDQICIHHIDTACEIACSLGWVVEHHTHHTGSGPLQLSGTAKGLLIRSPHGERCISLRISNDSGITVSVQTPTSREISLDKKWGVLGNIYKPVDWERMSGKTFADKFSMLLAALS